jgi:hypothetical protein
MSVFHPRRLTIPQLPPELTATGTLIASGMIACYAAPLSATPLNDCLRVLTSGVSVAGCVKVLADVAEDERTEPERLHHQAIETQVRTAQTRAIASYYRLHPHHYGVKPVPDEWFDLWGMTGGKPQIALAPAYSQPVQVPATPQYVPEPIQPVAPSPTPQPRPLGDYPPIDTGFISTSQSISETVSAPSPVDTSWIAQLINPSCLLVFGGDGSGKTTFATYLVQLRTENNHEIIAIDPHGYPGKWGDGVEVIGGGRNYAAISKAIADIDALVTRRYQLILENPSLEGQFSPITFLVEELTAFAHHIKNSKSLLINIGDYRKTNIHLLLVSHGDKLGQLGLPKGFSETITTIMSKVFLNSKIGANGEAVPTGFGWVQHRDQDKTPVQIPDLKHLLKNKQLFTETLMGQEFDACVDHDVQGSGVQGSGDERTLNGSAAVDEPELDRESDLLRQFVQCKALGMTKEQIIFSLWQARKGGTNAYKMANEFYAKLDSKYQETMRGDA